MDNKYDQIIQKHLDKFKDVIIKYPDIDFFNLIKAIIKVESNYNPNEIMVEKNVNDYSIGLMQLRIDTAQWINKLWSKTRDEIKNMLFNPDFNIYSGVKYVIYQTERYNGKIDDIIASYNAGSVKRNENGEYINKNYVLAVLKNYQKYIDSKKKL